MCGKFTALASWSEVVAFSEPLTETGGEGEGSNNEIITYRVGGLLPVIVWMPKSVRSRSPWRMSPASNSFALVRMASR